MVVVHALAIEGNICVGLALNYMNGVTVTHIINIYSLQQNRLHFIQA